MSTMAQMLLESRRRCEEEARSIIDRAESENRNLTGEETRQFEELGKRMSDLKSQSDRITKFDSDSRSAEAAMREIGGGFNPNNGGGDELIQQFRSVAAGERKGFDLPVTRQDTKVLSEHRALSKGTLGAGGATVPTSMVSRLYEHIIESATLIRAGATIFVTDSGETLDVPVTTAHSTAALVAESGTIASSDPTFAKRSLGAYKYGLMVYVPTELLQDTGVDLTGYLARQAGRAVGNALGAHLISGTGSGQPTGILTSTTLGVTTATAVQGVPSADNLMDLMFSVNPSYRNSPEAAWLIKDSTLGAIRKIKDSQGRYLWEPSLVAGQPDMLLGHPVLVDPNMPATGLNAKSVVFGDLSAYWTRIVSGVRFERSDDFKFDTDVVSFRCLIRGDGMLVDQSGAVKHLVGAAS